MGKVTRLPHDGRMIMGGKGSLTPFNPNQTSSSETKPQNTTQPDPMAPAATRYDKEARKCHI